MGRAPDGLGALTVALLAALMLTVVSVVHSRTTAGATPYSVYLDVPADNADGEMAGGVSTGMTTDVAELRAALDVVRAARVATERYSTLARQYWLAVGAENADIDLEQWEPARGLAANLDTVDKVYVNYLRLYNSHDGFWWTGMAGRCQLFQYRHDCRIEFLPGPGHRVCQIGG